MNDWVINQFSKQKTVQHTRLRLLRYLPKYSHPTYGSPFSDACSFVLCFTLRSEIRLKRVEVARSEHSIFLGLEMGHLPLCH